MWLFAGLAIILFLALATYDPGDPAFSVSADTQRIENRMGPAGAWFADLAYLLFGRPAYLFPVLVLLAGVFLFRDRPQTGTPGRSALWWRVGGFVLMLATSCGLATLHFFVPEMRETAGGIIGQLVGGGLEQILGLLGATVLLLVLWLAAASLATGVSWLAIMDYTGRGVLAAILKGEVLVNRAQIWLEGRRAKQQRQDLMSRSRAP